MRNDMQRHYTRSRTVIRCAILAGLILASAASAAIAQDTVDYSKLMKNSPAPPSLYGGITLTADQQSALNAIRDTARVYQAQINDEGGGPSVVAARTTALKAQQRAKIRALLTTEQQTQFDRNLVAVQKFEAYLFDLQVKRHRDSGAATVAPKR